MPSKIRYYLSNPRYVGAAARNEIAKLSALAAKDKALPSHIVLKEGKDWKSLSDNFKILKALGVFSKSAYFMVWRDRTHVRHNHSTYRQTLQMLFPKAKAGEWTFHYGNWYNQHTAWAVPLLKQKGFSIQIHPEAEESWRIAKLPLGYNATVVKIVDKKVLSNKEVQKQLAEPLQKTNPSDIAPQSGIYSLPPNELD